MIGNNSNKSIQKHGEICATVPITDVEMSKISEYIFVLMYNCMRLGSLSDRKKFRMPQKVGIGIFSASELQISHCQTKQRKTEVLI